MHKPIVHFAHANGFPAGSYAKMFNALAGKYTIIAKDKFAHSVNYPLTNNWENVCDELIDYVETHKQNQQKVVAVGHSFGAVLSYKAVCKRPDLFSQLIMLEPPLITGMSRYLFKIAKRTRLINKLTPAGITQIRAQKWHAQEDLFAYFSKKALFKHFDPQCIKDYVSAAVENKEGTQQLTFNVDNEANIFRTIPDNLPMHYHKLEVPSTLVSAQYTNICVPALRNPFIRGNQNMQHLEFAQAGHMFPLEKPLQAAQLIDQIIIEQELIND